MKIKKYASPELCEKIRLSLALPESATKEERFSAVAALLRRHTEYSREAVCKVAGIKPITYTQRLLRHGDVRTVPARKRWIATEHLRMLHPDKTKTINMADFLRFLNTRLSLHMSINTLRRIVKEEGYPTLGVNQTA